MRACKSGLLLLTAALLAGCAGVQPTTPTPTVAAEAAPTFTMPPSPTPTPWLLLLGPAPAARDWSTEAQSLEGFSDHDVVIVETLDQIERPAAPALIIRLPGSAGPAEIRERYTDAPIVMIDEALEDPIAGVVTLDTTVAAVRAAFTAGYITALLSSNYRSAIVTAGGDDSAQLLARAFADGVHYYCGLCRPAYPPFVAYPVQLSWTENSAGGVEEIVRQFTDADVQNVYLAPPLETSALAEALVAAGVRLIAQARPDFAGDGAWLAAVSPDRAAALQQASAAALAGGEPIHQPKVAVTEREPTVFSAARLRVVESMLLDLNGGFIGLIGR